MKICFLDNTKFKYNSNDKYSEKLRGAETALINLSYELSKLGHEVTVFNNCYKNETLKNIRWININQITTKSYFDLAFSNGNTNFFNKIISKKKILFSYSLQTIEKFIRKNQLISFLKHRPKVVLLSEYQKNKTSFIIKLFGYHMLDFAVDEIFIKSDLLHDIDNNLSIFTSKPDRNLNLLLNIWINNIFPNFTRGKLLITPPSFNIDRTKNIFFRNILSQKKMLEDVKKSRIFLIPGHKAELFCLAAEEARELCVPIVTLGIGCLSERVKHQKTGFIAKNNSEFSKYVIDLYNDDSLWSEIRNNLIQIRGSKKWNDVANKLLSII